MTESQRGGGFDVNFRTWFRSSATLVIFMFVILMLGAAIGAAVGPLELGLWLGSLVVGLILCALGSRRGPNS